MAINRYEWVAMRQLPMPLRRRHLYRRKHGCWPNLTSPEKFTEKINWRILNDRRQLLAHACDKLASKAFAQQTTGVAVAEVYWVGRDVGELSSIALPEQWVLKPNHHTGRVYFGRGAPDVDDIRAHTEGWVHQTIARDWGEWAYSQATEALFVEERLGDAEVPALDYRFFVFGGRCQMIFADILILSNSPILSNRLGWRRRMYRPDWTPLTATNFWPLDDVRAPPSRLEKMVSIAEALGRDFDMMRVDLYDVDGEIYFGELTPYPSGGLKPFDPIAFDYELGELWQLPSLAEHGPAAPAPGKRSSPTPK